MVLFPTAPAGPAAVGVPVRPSADQGPATPHASPNTAFSSQKTCGRSSR